MREEDFSSRGVRIHLRSWMPETAPRAAIVICHGVNSHGGQHAWTAEQFAARGFAVFALDLRGRGKSQGERFFGTLGVAETARARGATELALRQSTSDERKRTRAEQR